MHKSLLIALFCPFMAHAAHPVFVEMFLAENNTPIGQVMFEKSPFGGVLITPKLTGLPAGVHGFHIHEMPSCDATDHDGKHVPAGSAGAHYDPNKTNIHLGPYQSGHQGDLPVLIVGEDGTATLPMLAPRLNISELKGHALMIHAGGDNYASMPDPLGGGGSRFACGVISG